MNRIVERKMVVCCAVPLFLVAAIAARGAELGTAFTYQGSLVKNGSPVTGTCDLTFSLWDDLTGGNEVGASPFGPVPVDVEGGLFTEYLDFGPDCANGEARWLEITVQCPGDGGATTLAPRQELTPVPYALRAAEGVGPPGVLNVTPEGNVGIGTEDPGELLDVAGNIHASGEIGSGGTIALCGNPFPAIPDYIRSSDVMEFYVYHTAGCVPPGGGPQTHRALRLDKGGSNAANVNVIGGNAANNITAGVDSGTIGGGGIAGAPNRVTDDFGTVAGGRFNRAGDGLGSTTDAAYATVGGGINNGAFADKATVGGGQQNLATGDWSVVGGGGLNGATANYSTVSGGEENNASADHSTVGGGRINHATGVFSAISGGNLNNATGVNSTVGGGQANNANANQATIGGGVSNTVTASGTSATVDGGDGNTASGYATAIGGGFGNTAGGDRAVVGGGNVNAAGGAFAVIGGGNNNTASGPQSTVAGGQVNRALSTFNAIGGGNNNTSTGVSATIGGGSTNNVIGDYSTIGGGAGNSVPTAAYATIAGGSSNVASGTRASVGGGAANTASGVLSTVPGGNTNRAGGDFSFAAGSQAQVRTAAQVGDLDGDQGTFVWADTGGPFTSTGPNQFLIRADGGVGIGTASPIARLHVREDFNGPTGARIENLDPGTSAAPILTIASPSTSLSLVSYGLPFTGANRTGRAALIANSTSTGLDLVVNNTTTPHSMRFFTGGGYTSGVSERMIITDAGDVGIGISIPTAKLCVNGNIGYSGSLVGCSDARYKRNVEPVSDALALVDRLRPVRYDWRREDFPERAFSDQRQIGFIAQELQEVVPEVVVQGNDGYYSVDYGRLTPMLTQAIRDLRQEKNAEIEALRQVNSDLASRIAVLERAVPGLGSSSNKQGTSPIATAAMPLVALFGLGGLMTLIRRRKGGAR